MTTSQDPGELDDRATAAVDAMRRLALQWGVPEATLETLSALDLNVVAVTPLSTEQEERVGLLLTIYRSLHELYAEDLADRWVALENANELYQGRRPVDVMLEGGLPGG